MQILQFQCRKRIDGQRKKRRSRVALAGTFMGGFSILEKSDARVRRTANSSPKYHAECRDSV
jgi:hypothetical protein